MGPGGHIYRLHLCRLLQRVYQSIVNLYIFVGSPEQLCNLFVLLFPFVKGLRCIKSSDYRVILVIRTTKTSWGGCLYFSIEENGATREIRGHLYSHLQIVSCLQEAQLKIEGTMWSESDSWCWAFSGYSQSSAESLKGSCEWWWIRMWDPQSSCSKQTQKEFEKLSCVLSKLPSVFQSRQAS